MKSWIKKVGISLGVLLIFSQVPSAYAASGPVTSEGLFTSIDMTADVSCVVTDSKGVKTDQAAELSGEFEDIFETSKYGGKDGKNVFGWSDSSNSNNKVATMIGEPVAGSNQMMKENLFPATCKEEGFSFTDSVLKLTSPVNVTNNRSIMIATRVTQLIAFALAVLFVIAFAIMYIMGSHKLSPIKFAFRLFFAMVSVYFAPYLVQDILNLCNVLVYHISHVDFKTTAEAGDKTLVKGAFASLVFVQAIGAMLGTFIAGTIATGGLALLFLAAVAMILFALLIKPFLSLMMWWYLRLLNIFLLTVLSPLFLMMIALPQTVRYARKWFDMLIGETFTQLIVVILLYMYGLILSHTEDFMDATGINFMGISIMLYAMVHILADAPKIGQSLLGGGVGAGGEAMKGMTEGVGRVVSGAISSGNKRMLDYLKQGQDPNAKRQVKEDAKAQMSAVKGMNANPSERSMSSEMMDSVSSSGIDVQSANAAVSKGLTRAEKGAQVGQMTEERAKNSISRELQTSGMSEEKANQIADGVMMNEQERTGLSFNARSELGASSQVNRLSKEKAEDVVRNDILSMNPQLREKLESANKIDATPMEIQEGKHAKDVLNNKVAETMDKNGLSHLKSERNMGPKGTGSGGPGVKAAGFDVFGGRTSTSKNPNESLEKKFAKREDKYADLDSPSVDMTRGSRENAERSTSSSTSSGSVPTSSSGGSSPVSPSGSARADATSPSPERSSSNPVDRSSSERSSSNPVDRSSAKPDPEGKPRSEKGNEKQSGPRPGKPIEKPDTPN